MAKGILKKKIKWKKKGTDERKIILFFIRMMMNIKNSLFKYHNLISFSKN
jgi:hypothetical protein